MTAKEARETALKNRGNKDYLRGIEIMGQIADAIKEGALQTSFIGTIPEHVKNDLLADGFSIDVYGESSFIVSWENG